MSISWTYFSLTEFIQFWRTLSSKFSVHVSACSTNSFATFIFGSFIFLCLEGKALLHFWDVALFTSSEIDLSCLLCLRASLYCVGECAQMHVWGWCKFCGEREGEGLALTSSATHRHLFPFSFIHLFNAFYCDFCASYFHRKFHFIQLNETFSGTEPVRHSLNGIPMDVAVIFHRLMSKHGSFSKHGKKYHIESELVIIFFDVFLPAGFDFQFYLSFDSTLTTHKWNHKMLRRAKFQFLF